ncbi:hypothetical protein VNI00_013509 [Paramarasmius palmivorus]|uniref:Uncharacterized protein n=1 Tax=Paramarasmius palmivorus TaxID=297713 RepID=A0AAW0BXZ1_9AGAR
MNMCVMLELSLSAIDDIDVDDPEDEGEERRRSDPLVPVKQAGDPVSVTNRHTPYWKTSGKGFLTRPPAVTDMYQVGDIYVHKNEDDRGALQVWLLDRERKWYYIPHGEVVPHPTDPTKFFKLNGEKPSWVKEDTLRRQGVR